MAVHPTNCFICKNTWMGAGAICDDCQYKIKYNRPPPQAPPPICTFCAGAHETVDCLAAALQYQAQQAAAAAQPTYTYHGTQTGRWGSGVKPQMAKPRRPRRPIYSNYAPPLKYCLKCKSNYIIESKAGSVCSNCHTVIHNPCRNCSSQNTKGIEAVEFTVTTQFIECQDCLFIE